MFKGMRNSDVMLGLVVCTLFFGGCKGETEKPLLPANAFLAAYATDVTADMPVMKEFGRVFGEKRGILSELISQLKHTSIEQSELDPFQTYLAIDRTCIEWSLVTLGTLTRPEKGKEPTFPDATWTLCGTFDQGKIIEALTKRLMKNQPGMKLEASTRNGSPTWILKGDALNKVHGLTPCMAFSGKRLMLVASNEKGLQNLLDLYAGKGSGLPKEASLSRILDPDPNMIFRLMLVNLDDVIHTMTTEAERKDMVADPKVNAVINSLRGMTLEARVVPGQEAAECVLRVECADEANAQALSELGITAKTSASFLVNMALQKKPELKILAEWISKIAIRADGAQATLSVLHGLSKNDN